MTAMEGLSKKTSDVDDRVKPDMEDPPRRSAQRKHPHTKLDIESTSNSSEGIFSLPSFFIPVAVVQPGQHNVNCLVRVLRLLIASTRPLHPFSAVSANPFPFSFSPSTDQPSLSSPSLCTYSTGSSGTVLNIGNSGLPLRGAKGEDEDDGLLTIYEFLVADQTGSVKLVIYDQKYCAACKVDGVVAVVNAIASVVDGEVFLEVLEKAGGKVVQTSLSAKAFRVSEVPCISDVPVVPLRSALPADPDTS